MSDLPFLVALFVAVAAGWWLGRREVKKRSGRSSVGPPEYFEGLNFLVKEQADATIEMLLNAMGADASSVDTHLALGRLFRTRGEVDKATRVHQALLARQGLARDKLLLAQFELANDYMAAGLLDRAERLLKELSNEHGEVKWRSLELLMEIYQQEKDWDRAIACALSLLPKQGPEIRPVLAHYCCEKAEILMASEENTLARRELKRALNYDTGCVRASLLKGHLEAQTGHYREAVKALRRVKEQDPSYLPESIPKLSDCYRTLGKEKEHREFLLDCLQKKPSITLVFAVADLLYGKPGQEEQAQQFITEQLAARPSLKGVLHLLDIYLQGDQDAEETDLSELRGLIAQLIDAKPVYRCSSCGYSGRHLMWLCPGCQRWGKIKPIYGLEGE